VDTNVVGHVRVSSQVGVELAPAAGSSMQLQACSSVSAAAAQQLRLSVASVGNWRGALRNPIKNRWQLQTASALLHSQEPSCDVSGVCVPHQALAIMTRVWFTAACTELDCLPVCTAAAAAAAVYDQ
jgi:hypothetical protein